MRLRTRTWLLISVLSFIGAGIFWRLGEQRLSERSGRPPVQGNAPQSTSPAPAALPTPPSAGFQQSPVVPASLRSTSEDAAGVAARARTMEQLRLKNTDRATAELTRDNHTILLRNAVIDTGATRSLDVPQHLRAGKEPGSYIVQAISGITPKFRQTVEATGAGMVSYLPNNAYLVRATSEQAAAIQASGMAQAVLPNEPYFKLWETDLLAKAAAQENLEPSTRLNVILLPGARDEAVNQITALGGEILAESRTPFGPSIVIQAEQSSLVALAQLSAVQGIETHRPRQLLNDLARERLGVSSGINPPGTYTNYLGLTGTNVVININDSGVDQTHPDLEGRVTGDLPSTLIDQDGHGTHVAGTIAGSGSLSATVSNAPGSQIPGADFRGMAPAAELYALPIDLITGPLISDAYLQEGAATNYYIVRGKTNVLLSNNSWGYRGAFEYNISSASYDAAVRDALPTVTGSQPILYVFSAGNEGFGRDDGQGGDPGTISSPGTGKNVITVGAIESPRQITNEVVFVDSDGEQQTNQVFLAETDSDFQVTSFSSRGNIMPGVEGEFGRFKPDVVAPGAFTISARSRDWVDPRSFEGAQVFRLTDQEVVSGGLNFYSLFVPSDAAEFRLRILPNFRSPNPMPGLPIYLRYGGLPSTADLINTNNLVRVPPDEQLRSGNWFYGIGNLTDATVSYDVQAVITTTNDFGNYFDELKKLNDGLAPNYRYESGTSMSAPAVTGLLGLFVDYFQREEKKVSPSLLKALLINGARSVGSLYNFNLGDVINLQGWGLVNLTNSLPVTEIGTGSGTNNSYSVQYADMAGPDAVVTGEERRWRISVAPEARDQILKVTLVWTDPPGNPTASIKLVNDLDLIVTNAESAEVFAGNDIPFRSDYNTPRADFVSAPSDVVNNVENVLLQPPLGTNYTIIVRGSRVNVNAVTDHPDGIAQDFSLVVGMEDTSVTNVLSVTPETLDIATHIPLLVLPTNGLPLLGMHVGATPPIAGRMPGPADQWTFFVFTNLQEFTPADAGITNGSNVAFITFSPPNLSRPRNREADLDLYVSKDPQLTNLVPAVVTNAFRSTRPGGTEFVTFTNSNLGDVFYVGVKAEDQQAAEFGFVALSSELPFDEDDENGNRIVRGTRFNVPIPDGSADQPHAAIIFGVATRSFPVQRVIVTNTMAFDSTGDILGNLSHNDAFVVLNNHALDPTGQGGVFTTVYDDSSGGNTSYGSILGIPTDGPGSLTDFIGTDAVGPWMLTVTDNALTQSATNVSFYLLLEPQAEEEGFIFDTVAANSANFYFIDVPTRATNLTVTLQGLDNPLFLAIRRGDLPTFSVYDKAATISPPGGALSIGTRDLPPLNAGRYYIGVFNPNAVPVNYGINVEVDLDLNVSGEQAFGLGNRVPLNDDARITSLLNVSDDRQIAAVKVGLRVRHPRISDLAFHLVSPQGTRLLLSENRGGPDGTDYGADLPSGRRLFTSFTDDTNLTTTPIKIGVAPFTNNFATVTSSNRIIFSDSFEDAIARQYLAGESFPHGWRVLSGAASIVQVPPGSTNAYDGVQYLSLADDVISSIGTNVTLTVGKPYRVRFAVGVLPVGQEQGLAVYVNGTLVHEVRRDPGPQRWYTDSFFFPATTTDTLIEFRGPPSQTGRRSLALDGVIFEDLDQPATAYYHPEEPLKPLIGERAFGTWKLEVDDTRVGPAGGGTGDLDWRLEFIFAQPTIDAIQLTNNVPYFGSVSGVDVQYFYVQVPRCATMAVNTLAGSFATLVLFGDRDGLPFADLSAFRDDYGPYLNVEPGGIAQFTLTTNSPASAPLRPGQRYYLAVRNFQPDLTNNAFGIRVQFDCEDPLIPVVPSLTNAIPQLGTIDPGPNLHYYQFVVSSNAIRAEFELTPGNGNVDMFIRYAQPIPGSGSGDEFPLPSPTSWDYKADNPDSSIPDLVSVDRTSQPVGLAPGVWFIAIRNGETFPVDYSIKATEFYTTIINLTNAVPYSSVIDPVDPNVGVTGDDLQYYAFLVSSNSVRAQFEIQGPTGDVNLYVRKTLPIPTPFDFDLSSVNPGTENEFIAVTNTSSTIWLSPGWWYLSVENADVTNVAYNIVATEFPAQIIPLTNDVPYTNIIAAGENLDYYSFNVSSNALSAKFEVYGMSEDVQLLLRQALPVPTFNDHTYASTNTGLIPEVIELTAFSFPVALSPGNWYLSIANPGTNNATYIVEATEETAQVIPLTNGVPYNASIDPGPALDYYSFNVSSNALAAEFKLTSASTGDLDLYLRRGPPLPAFGNAHYVSTNLGVVDEMIRLETNTLPIPLGPGIWYLAVTNKEAVPITYEITATEFGVEEPPVSGVITNIDVSTNQVCITWVSIPGTNYYIVAKASVLDPTWTPVSPTITATGTSTTWCLEPPGPWRFFDVFEGESPSVPIPGPVPVLRLDGTNICVSWASVVGTNYFVQGKQRFGDPNWVTLTPSIVAVSTNTEVCYPIVLGYRLFRVGLGTVDVPTPTPLPADVVVVDPGIDTVCITWPTQAGLDYIIEGKRTLDEVNWTVISESIRGTGGATNICLTGTTEFRYFRVIEGVTVPIGPPPSVPVPNVGYSLDAAFQLCLTWDTLVGAEYFVEGKARIADPTWTVISPILQATGVELSYCQPLGSPWRYLQVRRVNTPPASPVRITEIVLTANGPAIRWTGTAGTRYQVFTTDSLMGTWTPVGGQITSVTTAFEFVDTAAVGGGTRFYRIQQLP